MPSTPRYRTLRKFTRIAQTGKVTPQTAQYLARRAVRTVQKSGQREVKTNYRNPVVRDGKRIN